jgi:hypothetical protein
VNVYAIQPETSIQNSQVGVRIAGRVLGLDLATSYYHGRFGIPTPAWVVQKPDGLVDVSVIWPRMDVLGASLAGSIEKLGGLGYWLEAGLYFPEKVTYGIYNDSMGGHDPITFEKDASGKYVRTRIVAPEADRGVVIPSTPFLKLTAGVDYSFNKYLYGNLQYVYGFIDEFGAGKQAYALPGAAIGDPARTEARIGHYLVAGADLKLFSDQLLIRMFGAFKVPQIGDESPRFTAVIFPQLSWAVWQATELQLGAFVFLGDRASKFGDPAAGASEIFLKAKFTY